MLSNTELDISRHYACARMGKNVKLVRKLMKKAKYVVHLANLKFYLDHGLGLTKIHRVLRFAQSPWMASYIELNMAIRGAAQNEKQRDFHKLKNNAVSGKTCENQRKRNDIRLLTDQEKIGKFVYKQQCLNVEAFDRILIAVEFRKLIQIATRPSYVGFSVLELSKLHMYPYATLIYFDLFKKQSTANNNS